MSCQFLFLQYTAIEMDPRSKQDAVRSEPLNIADIYADETTQTVDEVNRTVATCKCVGQPVHGDLQEELEEATKRSGTQC